MNVILFVFGTVKVDDSLDRRNIKASRCNIGSNENAGFPTFEPI